MPLAGRCIDEDKLGEIRLDKGVDESKICGGKIVLTVTEGSVRKYIKVTRYIIENYGVDLYTQQRVDWLSDSVDSLFNDDTVTVMTLGDFL
jgi:DNA polymerase II large subunit